MIENIQVRTQQKIHEAFSSWIGAGAPPQNMVSIGITPNDELLFPAVAAVNDISHFLDWWWFI
jgi:hypothetical protein